MFWSILFKFSMVVYDMQRHSQKLLIFSDDCFQNGALLNLLKLHYANTITVWKYNKNNKYFETILKPTVHLLLKWKWIKLIFVIFTIFMIWILECLVMNTTVEHKILQNWKKKHENICCRNKFASSLEFENTKNVIA